MFEQKGGSATEAAGAVESIGAAARAENAAGAARLAAIGDLYELRAPVDNTARLCWAIDGWASLVVEVAAALGVSRGRAKAHVNAAVALRERLPQVAAVYRQGLIDGEAVALIIARTDLIVDDDALRAVDAAVAAKVVRWGRLSWPKMRARIDAVIAEVDPAGVRAPCESGSNEYVAIDPAGPGQVVISAVISATAGASLDVVLEAIAAQPCADDPRTHAQRRAAAVGVLATGGHLKCLCGMPDCPTATEVPDRAAAPAVGARAMIHVIATPETVTGQERGFLVGYGPVPGGQVLDLLDDATIRHMVFPPDVAEEHYRPSAKLAEFVRCRDVTCRFPDCDRPAESCDLDHTIPYPVGPTHPSNLKALCRFHHLVKTFDSGWRDQQFPDGSIVWTSPTGHTYVTKPEGAYWFPQLGAPTGTLPPTVPSEQSARRGMCMPTRRRPYTAERRTRIMTERRVNQTRLDEQQHRREEELIANDEPAPF